MKLNKSNEVIDNIEEDEVNEIVDYPLYEDYAEEKVDDAFKMPLFDGQATMIARMMLPAKHFDVWAEVSAICEDGTLFSASGRKDYVWLGFMNNKAVLRWDAGSGATELHAGIVATDGRLRVSARRYKKDAVLRMGSAAAQGSAHGRMISLNTNSLIYIGHPPDNVTKLSGTSSLPGFIGCIHRLRVSGRDFIPPERGMRVTGHNLRPCTPDNLSRLVCP